MEEEANLESISLLNYDTLLHVIDSIDDTHAIVAFCLSSKRFLERVVSLIQPKLQYGLPLSFDKYTSLIKRVNVYRSLISARDTAPGLQFFEFESQRSNPQQSYNVITKTLPWNTNFFVEISSTSTIEHNKQPTLCVYSMDRATPVYQFDLLHGENRVDYFIIDSYIFNSRLKYFALAFRFTYASSHPINARKKSQSLHVYSFKEDNTVEKLLEYGGFLKESYNEANPINMAVSDEGNLWISHYNKGPACISLIDGSTTYLASMRRIDYCEYKGQVLAVSLIPKDKGISAHIQNMDDNTEEYYNVSQYFKFGSAKLHSIEVKGDLVIIGILFKMFNLSDTDKRIDYISIDLVHKMSSYIGPKSISGSGNYLLEQTDRNLLITSFMNKEDDLSGGRKLNIAPNLAKSGCELHWGYDCDILVGSVPFNRCLIDSSNDMGNNLTAFKHLIESISFYEMTPIIKLKSHTSVERIQDQLKWMKIQTTPTLMESIRPAIVVCDINGADGLRVIELPYDSELFIKQCIVSIDRKHLLIVGTCGLQTVVLKMRL